MCFLVTKYLVKDKGSNGCDHYLSVAECEEFVTSGNFDRGTPLVLNDIGYKVWGGEESADSDYPTGCYIYHDTMVYFNPTTAGSGRDDSQQVCGLTSDNIFFSIFKTKLRFPSKCLCHHKLN